MRTQNKLNSTSIQKWCEEMEQCQPVKMDYDTASFFMQMMKIEELSLLEESVINQSIEENKMALLIRNRVNALHTYKLTDYAALFLSVLCDRPGFAVQMVNFIQYKCWKNKKRTVDIKTIGEFFQNGFFSIDDLLRMWNKLKFVNSYGYTANMLDFPEYMESIKNI